MSLTKEQLIEYINSINNQPGHPDGL